MRQDAVAARPTADRAESPGVRLDVPASAENRWIEVAYDNFARELWAVFYAQCSDPELAREALQEAFLRLHGQRPDALRDVRAWLVQVGRNWLRDVIRHRRHAARPVEFLDDLPVERPGPLDAMESDETQAQVRACLSRLREDDRQALVLRYALNWPSARMAEVLGVSAAAVDMRLSRARKRLADLLRDDGFPVPEGS